MSYVTWHKAVWFKGYALNFVLYTWLAINGGLKYFEVFCQRGIGSMLKCLLCESIETNSRSHLFFLCSYSLYMVKSSLTMVSFFLLEPTIYET